MKFILTLLTIVGCYVGLPGAAFLICYLCGLTKPGEMSGHWIDNAGMRHEPQANPGGLIMTFILMLVALIVAVCICIPILDKVDKIKD
jgi:hypothetical protein